MHKVTCLLPFRVPPQWPSPPELLCDVQTWARILTCCFSVTSFAAFSSICCTAQLYTHRGILLSRPLDTEPSFHLEPPQRNTPSRRRTSLWQGELPWKLALTTCPRFWISWCAKSHSESFRRQKSSKDRGVGIQTAVVVHGALWLIGRNRVAILVKCSRWMPTRLWRCSRTNSS